MSISNLNMDVRQRVIQETRQIAWLPSPLEGVERRMLERENEESGLATSVVRYAPDSYFSPHVHAGGEEYLVLDGTFSDETGNHKQGFYVRNPPGSRHQPFSKRGCTIFVKLCQMQPEGEPHVVIDTRSSEVISGVTAGHTIQPLFESPNEQVRIERLAPGASIEEANDDGLEILVLDGELGLGGQPCVESTWARIPPGERISLSSPTGCWYWIKRGHLSSRLT